jgi:hypothetical protein
MDYLMNDLDKIWEVVKDNKIGWRQETMIGDKRYLVFIRPDLEVSGTEVVFRELLIER